MQNHVHGALSSNLFVGLRWFLWHLSLLLAIGLVTAVSVVGGLVSALTIGNEGLLLVHDMIIMAIVRNWRIGWKDAVQNHGNDSSNTVSSGEEDRDTVANTLQSCATVSTSPESGRVRRSSTILEGVGPNSDTDTNSKGQGHDEFVASAVQVNVSSQVDTRDEHIGK